MATAPRTGSSHQINLAVMSRDELIELVKKQNVRLKEAVQAKEQAERQLQSIHDEHREELKCVQEQNALLKDQVAELRRGAKASSKPTASSDLPSMPPMQHTPMTNGEIHSFVEPLQQQIAILSDKVATDEETIADLLKQLEQARAAKGGREDPSQQHQPTAAAAARITELEHTITELNETNAFYAAVVSQQDKTEHAQQAKIDELEADIKRLKAELAACPKCLELRMTNEELQGRCSDQDHEISTMREKVWNLKKALTQENQQHQIALDKLRHVELECTVYMKATETRLAEMQDQVKKKVKQVQETAATAPQDGAPPSHRGRAASQSGTQQSGGSSSPSPGGGASSIPTSSPPLRVPIFQNLPVVPVVRNPTKREQQLLDRLTQFDTRLKEYLSYEEARQKRQDEAEKNRAELFVSLTAELETKKKEIAEWKAKAAGQRLGPTATTQPSSEPSPTTQSEGVEALSRTSKMLHDVEAQRDMLLLQVSQLEEDVHQLKSQLAEMQSLVTSLDQELNAQRSNGSQGQEQLLILQHDKEELQTKLTNALAEAAKVGAEKDSLQRALDSHRNVISGLEQQVSALNQQKVVLEQQAASTTAVRPETEPVQPAVAASSSVEAQTQIQALNAKIRDLEEALAAWKARCRAIQAARAPKAAAENGAAAATAAPPPGTIIQSRNLEELALLESAFGGGVGIGPRSIASLESRSRASSIADSTESQ